MNNSSLIFALLLVLIQSLQACAGKHEKQGDTNAVRAAAPVKAPIQADTPVTQSTKEVVTQSPVADLPIPRPPNKPEIKTKVKASNPQPTTAPSVPAAENSASPPPESAVVPAPTKSEYPDHSAWSSLLKTYVSTEGEVDYKGLNNEQGQVEVYLASLSSQVPAPNWPRAQAMAYWINAYNAATVLLILNNYPLKSIMDLDQGKTWDVKRINLGGKFYSLNQIENEILRPKYKDARIHFAVNCAAKGCPPLYNEAFLPAKLEQQLEARTAKFIKNKKYNQVEAGSAKISKIFDWYAADFGQLTDFLNKYLANPIGSVLKWSYNDYDWALNGK